MKRVKVALDVSVPQRAVRLLQTGFGDQGFEFIYETEFAAANAADEFWATAFRRFGGQIVISGDKNIARRPHQVLAFKANDLICFFNESRWGNMDGTFKVAHLIYWWPRIQTQISNSKPRDCWWVPVVVADREFSKVELPDHVKGKERTAKEG